LIAGVTVQLRRSIPLQSISVARALSVTVPGNDALPWPSTGQAAVTVEGVTQVRTSGPESPVPIASLAKMMTALIILHDHPLQGQNPGPNLTVSAADMATYMADVAVQGSVLKVAAGEALSERLALEALMIPSADNIATLLAEWDAGSVPSFVAKMNASAASLGLKDTSYTDPSGLASSTVSTARDQLFVASAAMSNPVLAAIVAMQSATFPLAGVMGNINHDVGHFGIVGVKTGSDSAAQGCWAFAAARTVAGTPRAVFGVVLGIHGTAQGFVVPALAAGLSLANAIPNTVRLFTVVRAGAVVAYVHAPWRAPIAVRAAVALRGIEEAGQHVTMQIVLHTPHGTTVGRGNTMGSLSTPLLSGATRTSLVSGAAGSGPSLWWRLTRS
jgi:D-alanyl-D-alanine carboxypeptidase (penicillin-binding protein 5/6)